MRGWMVDRGNRMHCYSGTIIVHDTRAELEMCTVYNDVEVLFMVEHR